MPTEHDYDLISTAIGPHRVGSRTASAALLAWFLTNVWRLDADDVATSICDGGGDKGIDGLTIDEDAGEIAIFQAQHHERPDRTQGDVGLKQLRGSAAYFHGPEGIDLLLASKPRPELQMLVKRLGVREKLAEGRGRFSVRLVYVTNAIADASAKDYLKVAPPEQPPLELWTRDRLAPIARRTESPDLLPGPHMLRTEGRPLVQQLGNGRQIAIALVRASDVVRLPGIEDLGLFHFNVRLGLGKTRINKEIQATIGKRGEHDLFPAYHNGLTLITSKLNPKDGAIELTDLSVVNGCQSLLALRDSQGFLSDALRLIVKVIEVGADKTLAETITFRSNNQNPVNIRDQRATDAIQRDLQRQVRDAFAGRFDYLVRRGETPQASEFIENDKAAQLILAIRREEPWSAVRRTRLFDDEYHRIFNRDVDAFKIRAAFLIDKAVEAVRDQLVPALQASFAAIRFTLCHLLAVAVRQSDAGRRFLEAPGDLLRDREQDVVAELRRMAAGIVLSVRFYVKDKEDRAAEAEGAEFFDPKVAFKSKVGVHELERDVVRDIQRDIAKDPETAFGARWR